MTVTVKIKLFHTTVTVRNILKRFSNSILDLIGSIQIQSDKKIFLRKSLDYYILQILLTGFVGRAFAVHVGRKDSNIGRDRRKVLK